MSDENFDIYFSGKILPDADLAEVRTRVGQLFNADARVLDQLFCGKPVKIKKAVDMDTAIKYRVKFREAGAIIDIRPTGQPAPAPAAAPTKPQPTAQPATESEPVATSSPPPASGTDQSSAEPAAASISAIDSSLAAAGSIIDDTPAPPPAQFNTDDLQLGPANQGSLEEFAEQVNPAEIPDISQMSYSEPDGHLDERPAPPPLEVDLGNMRIDTFADVLDDSLPPPPADIDTASLSAAPPNSGSLEEFDSRPAPVPLPDISRLKLDQD